MKIGILNGTTESYVPYEIFVKKLNILVPNKYKLTKTTSTVEFSKDFPKPDAIAKYLIVW